MGRTVRMNGTSGPTARATKIVVNQVENQKVDIILIVPKSTRVKITLTHAKVLTCEAEIEDL